MKETKATKIAALKQVLLTGETQKKYCQAQVTGRVHPKKSIHSDKRSRQEEHSDYYSQNRLTYEQGILSNILSNKYWYQESCLLSKVRQIKLKIDKWKDVPL